MNTLYLYGDESGTHHKNDESTHFVYSCIILNSENRERAYEVRNHISKYFYGMKKVSSKSIRKIHFHRRIAMIKYLTENLEFSIYTLIVKKSELASINLEHKNIFTSFFHNIIIRNIVNDIESLQITLDSTGNSEFSTKLRKTLIQRNNEIQVNLFNQKNDLLYVSDDDEPLLQLADLVAGSISKIYTGLEKNPRWEELFRLLDPKMISPIFFPANSILSENQSEQGYQVDKDIYEHVVENAEKYLFGNEDRVKSVITEHLLKYSKIYPSRLIEVYELVDKIHYELKESLTPEQVRLHIRDLRYNGLLVVSKAGRSGYKLAVNYTDVNSYFQHYLNYITPMLQKIIIADDKINLMSAGQKRLIEKDSLISKLTAAVKFHIE